MVNSFYNSKGMSFIEVLCALFVTSVGILSLLSLQPSAWDLSRRSDRLGRAGAILHRELETNELRIMNPNNANPCAGTNPFVATKSVYTSGQGTVQPGDASFTVQTTIQDNLDTTWSVRIRVTWPENATGISDTRIVTRQEPFRS